MTQPLFWTRHTLAQPRMVGSACLISLALACSPDPEPSNSSPEMDQGPGQVDMQVDPPGPDADPDEDEEMGPPVTQEDMGADMPPACEPLVQCPEDACGMIDDTCGSKLDCGACACEGGTLTLEDDACGPCGLGRLTCGDDETGAGTCVAPETGAVDLSAACNQRLYVQEGASAQLADGTVDFPYPSVHQALEDAATLEGPALVLLGAGTYEETPAGREVPAGIEMREQVSVVGGFDDQWRFDPVARTRIKVSQPEDSVPLIGVEASGIDELTALAHVQVVTRDLIDGAGMDNYGLRARSSSGLVVSHVLIEAGGASDGANGMDGLEGANGEPGGDAGVAIWGERAARPAGGIVNGADPGAPGMNTLCPAANGGGGGLGAHAWRDSSANTAGTYDAEDGLNSSGGGKGGPAGISGSPDGENGFDGSDGDRGEDGREGVRGGQLENGFWVLANGDGEPGEPGEHGAGGGGGGGSWWPTADMSEHGIAWMPGGSGGGGGAGGCGGGGGIAGTAGGSSIGALFVLSDGLILIQSTFRAGDAGDGGSGGRGGRPGSGALGGRGTTRQHPVDPNSPNTAPHPLDSGTGAAGGDGGEGGDGGSGIGGSSFGALCEGTRLELQGEVTFEAGAGGTGGQGSLPAPEGEAADQLNCQ